MPKCEYIDQIQLVPSGTNWSYPRVSDLIAGLQVMLEKYGDLPIHIDTDTEWSDEFNQLAVREESDGKILCLNYGVPPKG